MVKPNVLCVGFAKCGTTTFYDIMNKHKDIFLSGIKEPIYYSREKFYKKGFTWYQKRYYPKKVKEKIIMEVNPMLAKRVEPQIIEKDYGKDVKIIFLIRNPMDRLYSNFKMNLMFGGCFEKNKDNIGSSTSKLFHKWLEMYYDKKENNFECCIPTNFVLNGEYYENIKKYIDVFGKKNVKVIIFEDFIKEPHQKCQEIYKFIGIKDDKTINYNVHSNEGNRLPKSSFSIKIYKFYYYKICMTLLEKIPYISNSFCRFIDYLNWAGHLGVFSKKDKNPQKMFPEDRELLRKHYYDEVKKLSKLLDIDLLQKWKME